MEAHDLVARIPGIFEQVNRLLALANENLELERQRFGGYLTVLDANDGKVLLVLACGFVPKDKTEKYYRLSIEKAKRVFVDKQHNTSWDSRDEANSQYPGAIRGVEGVYSFSGHQSDVDEAISASVFYLAESTERISEKTQSLFDFYYQEVAERNQFIRPFIKLTK